MCTSDIICITNRGLCVGDFLERMERIAAAKPRAVILREKDLSPEAYRVLAAQVMAICRRHGVFCILHTFAGVAAELGAEAVHLPLPVLRELKDEEKARFLCIGASCHSVEDALEAQKLGCSYITAGHVFDTDCKRGLPGRGLDFLQKICAAVDIPVYAIGGVCAENVAAVRAAGAAGVCVMSGAMRCDAPEKYLHSFC